MASYNVSLPKRAPVYGHAAVATSHPLATAAGVEVLLKGGNAADAAIAVGAALCVTEPCANGLGGDLIALHYSGDTQKVSAVMGNGAAPAALNLKHFPLKSGSHASAVTVPGVVKAWEDICEQFGSRPLSELLAPAEHLAREGFAVGPRTALAWEGCSEQVRQHGPNSLLIGEEQRSPRTGEIFINEDLANVLDELRRDGACSFYNGPIANRIADAVANKGGSLSVDDMAAHRTLIVDPISTTYRGVRVHESGPPTHGVAALLALNIAECFDVSQMKRDEEEYLHTLVECTRLAYGETCAFVADPSHSSCRVDDLLNKKFASKRAMFIGTNRSEVSGCTLDFDGGTTQFVIFDGHDAMSVVQSNYKGFGTGIVPERCGFSLNNRATGFTNIPRHPNSPAPGKKPYHTIIAGMLTDVDDGSLIAALGVMGSYMQPQGHMQLVTALVDHGLDAQEAVDALRFRATGPFSACEGQGEDEVLFPENVDSNVLDALTRRGHVVRTVKDVGPFGRAQIITRDRASGVACAGSDSRSDGNAVALPKIAAKSET